MRPFDVSPALESLLEAHLSAEALLSAARAGNRGTRYALARLWLSEGIPHCFKARPGLYESLRGWLGYRLGVDPKEITLVGSGRLGFCLSPGPDLCRPFGEHSDLDLTVVSALMFKRMETTFTRWHADYAGGQVSPRNERERFFWEDNRKRVPSGLARGFIDPYTNWSAS